MSDTKKPTAQECVEFLDRLKVFMTDRGFYVYPPKQAQAMLTEIEGIVEDSQCTCYMEQDGSMDIVVCKPCEQRAIQSFKEQQPQPDDLVEKLMYIIDHNTTIPPYNNRGYIEKQIRTLLEEKS